MKDQFIVLVCAMASHLAVAQPALAPGRKGYAEVETAMQRLRQQGVRFDVTSERTWTELTQGNKSGFLDAIKVIERSDWTPAEKSRAVNNLAAKADLAAFEALARSGRYPNIALADSVKIDLLGEDWKKLANQREVGVLDMSSAAFLAKYRVDLERFSQWPYDSDPRRTPWDPAPGIRPRPSDPEPRQPSGPSVGSGSQQMGTAGTQNPLPPDSPPPPSIQARIDFSLQARLKECQDDLKRMKRTDCSRSTGYTVSDVQIAHGKAVEVSVDDRRSDSFNPVGFLEVVRIGHMHVRHNCTGTLIAETLVLTAKHCTNDSKAEHLLVFVPKWDPAEYEECKKAQAEKKPPRQCVGFDKIPLAKNGGIRPHPSESVDLTILTLAQPVGTRFRTFAKVSFDSAVPTKISAAGYGDWRTDRPIESRSVLDVGWFVGEVDLRNGKMSWRPDQMKGNTVSCKGDSGGPVFKGIHAGYNLDVKPRELIAVISGAPGGQQECGAQVVTQTSLASTEAANWLCEQKDVPTSGCSTTMAFKNYKIYRLPQEPSLQISGEEMEKLFKR